MPAGSLFGASGGAPSKNFALNARVGTPLLPTSSASTESSFFGGAIGGAGGAASGGVGGGELFARDQATAESSAPSFAQPQPRPAPPVPPAGILKRTATDAGMSTPSNKPAPMLAGASAPEMQAPKKRVTMDENKNVHALAQPEHHHDEHRDERHDERHDEHHDEHHDESRGYLHDPSPQAAPIAQSDISPSFEAVNTAPSIPETAHAVDETQAAPSTFVASPVSEGKHSDADQPESVPADDQTQAAEVDTAGEAGEGDDIDEADEEDDDGDDDDDQDLTKLQLVAKATAALPQESSDHYTVMQSLHEAASDTGQNICGVVNEMFDKVISELTSYTGNVSDQGLTIAKKDENIQTQYGELSLLNEETGKMQANMNGLSLAMPGSTLNQ